MTITMTNSSFPSQVPPGGFPDCVALMEFVVATKVEEVELGFTDAFGCWHCCSFVASLCKAEELERGMAFDGSSVRLFTTVDHSDMLMVPDPSTCWVDPFARRRTLHVVCSVADTEGVPFERCPRQMTQKAVDLVQRLGIADTVYVGCEPEFFVFDKTRFCVEPNEVSFEIHSSEGYWNGRQRKVAGGYNRPPTKWYLAPSPLDTMSQLRSEMLETLGNVGIEIEKHHHEEAVAQHEVGFRFDRLMRAADNLMTAKYVVKNVARAHDKTATFMPKPIFGDNGSGLHVHLSLWKNGGNLFFDQAASYAHLSVLARQFIGGILQHANAVFAFTNSSINSYKRLNVPGFSAPTALAYSKGNRSAAIRIPLTEADNAKAKRIECRFPDNSGCPYLSFTVLILAGIDGIRQKMDPPAPLDIDHFQPLNGTGVASKKAHACPKSLSDAIDSLEEDHAFLTRDGVVPERFVMDYIKFKRDEIAGVELVPHPKEFELYFNC